MLIPSLSNRFGISGTLRQADSPNSIALLVSQVPGPQPGDKSDDRYGPIDRLLALSISRSASPLHDSQSRTTQELSIFTDALAALHQHFHNVISQPLLGYSNSLLDPPPVTAYSLLLARSGDALGYVELRSLTVPRITTPHSPGYSTTPL